MIGAFSVLLGSMAFSFDSQATATSGSSKTYDISYSISGSNFDSSTVNTGYSIDYTYENDGNHEYYYTYFYRAVKNTALFTPSTSAYAYKIVATPDVTVSTTRVPWMRWYVGTQNDIGSGTLKLGRACSSTSASTIWYFNENTSEPLFCGALIYAYEYLDYSETGSTVTSYKPSYSISGTVSYVCTPYTMEDALDDISSELAAQTEQNEEIITLLESIDYYTTTNNTLLKTYLPQLAYILEECEAMNIDLDTVKTKLTNINATMSLVYKELQDVNSELDNIIAELITQTGQNATVIELLDLIKTYTISNNSLLKSYLPKLVDILAECEAMNIDLDTVISELENISSELAKITSSSSSDKTATDNFASDSNNQSSSLNDLNEQTTVDRIDVDGASDDVDSYIDMNATTNYGSLLSIFTTNEKIVGMIMVTLACGLLSYVFFGKR